MAYSVGKCVFLVKRFEKVATVIMIHHEFLAKLGCRKASSRSAINSKLTSLKQLGACSTI
jgi:hypothetical protein